MINTSGGPGVNMNNKRPLLQTPISGKAGSIGNLKNNNNKKFKTSRGGDGEVLKVKLLTGTLFLYRGVHRHVEFIPRI